MVERIYWHKARLRERYILEMEIFRVQKTKEYKDGVKYGLILIDPKTGKKVLMDNHNPKGPHVHLNEKEFPYEYVNEDKLIKDFKNYVLNHMEVKI